MIKELHKKRYLYYSQIFVLFELVKTMRDREVVFLDYENNANCIRMLRFRTIDYLKKLFSEFSFFERNYNIYISVAKYEEIPEFTYNLKERSSETKPFFMNNSAKFIYNYDMLLDFDCRDIYEFPKVLKEVNNLHAILSFEKIKHYIIPSGSGFQIIIPNECFNFRNVYSNDTSNQNTFNYKIKILTQKIKDRFKLKYLDMKGIGTLHKIMKCPYSLVLDNVVLPLNSLKDFQYKYMDCNVVKKNTWLRDRGLLWKNDFSPNDNKINMNKFIVKYSLGDKN